MLTIIHNFHKGMGARGPTERRALGMVWYYVAAAVRLCAITATVQRVIGCFVARRTEYASAIVRYFVHFKEVEDAGK